MSEHWLASKEQGIIEGREIIAACDRQIAELANRRHWAMKRVAHAEDEIKAYKEEQGNEG